jgi:hypothetical protein
MLKLRLTYLQTSDGPWIVVFGPLGADFQSLQRFFLRLSQAPGEALQLDEQEFISAFGGAKVRLVSADAPFSWTSSQCEGVRHLGRESAPEYEWRETPEVWGEIAEFIEPIVARFRRGDKTPIELFWEALKLWPALFLLSAYRLVETIGESP